MPNLPFNFSDFHGGVNLYNAYDLLTENEARDVSNVQGTTAGAIVKRGGFQTVGTLANVAMSIYAPTQLYVIVANPTAGTLVRVDTTNGTQTTLKSGITYGYWQFVRGPSVGGQGRVYGMNGIDTPVWWNDAGTTVGTWSATDVGGSLPNGSMCVLHQNQVYVAGTTGSPSRLYWSGIGDPTAWNPANLNGSGSMDFDPDDGYGITGLGQVGPYVLVFKPHKTWVLVDAATATDRKLSDSIGCVAKRSVTSAPEGTYFLSADRVYLTDGSKLQPISDKIQPALDGIVTRGQAAGCYFNAHYYLSVNLGGAANDTTFDWDARLQSWWKHTIGVNDWAIYEKYGSTTTVLYAANAGAAFISRAFTSGVYQDNGSNFTWSWSGPWLSPSFYRRRRFPTPYFRKRLRQTRYDGTGQVDFSICKDFNTTPIVITADIFSNSLVTLEARSYGQGVANTFSAVFSGTYNNPAQLNQYTLFINDRRDQMPG